MTRPTVLCACCGREGPLEARKLIKSCYERRRVEGSLEAYPAARLPRGAGRLAGLTLAEARADERDALDLYRAAQKAAAKARAHLTAMQARRRLLEGAPASEGRAA